jgi:SpoIID/LytB domain protein
LGLPYAGYPYFAVTCAACQADPVRWSRMLSAEDAALLSNKGEAGRLALCRKLGWNAVPSNNFTARDVKGEVQIDGVGQGHGIGLCQRGAQVMAISGSTYREILAHYFPKTKIENTVAEGADRNSGAVFTLMER